MGYLSVLCQSEHLTLSNLMSTKRLPVFECFVMLLPVEKRRMLRFAQEKTNLAVAWAPVV